MMKRLIALLALLTLLGAAQPAPQAQAAAASPTCEANTVWGFCFETLPKLWCCSAAFLGWSEILAGDTFPVTGRMGPGQSRLTILFPSGRALWIPARADGSFHQVITFDEEGGYRILVAGQEDPVAGFQVAYRAELLDLPSAESQFGRHHARTGVTLGAVEAGKAIDLRIRFTDAKGMPVRSRSLAIGWGQQVFATDRDGVATIHYQPDQSEKQIGYSIRRLYPGLGLVSYREVRIDGDGRVYGLPGGELEGIFQEGRWYLPLRAFLEKAAPLRFGDMPERIQWEESTRTIRVEGLRIMLDTGMVLGQADFRSSLIVRDGRTYMDLHSMVQLLDRLGMAARNGEFAFRLSLAQEP